MKRYLFCIYLLFLTCMLIQSKERTIKCPPFIAWSSNSIEISKVGISDTATVLYIKAFYHPKQWIRIASKSFLRDNNGETYPLRSGIGIKLDTEFWMPESGEAEFQLIFPALPKTVTSIDFSEGDNVQGAFKIWGIQLRKNKLPRQNITALTSSFDITDNIRHITNLSYGKAIFKGKILDYRPGMVEEIYLNLSRAIVGETQNIKIRICPDGSFSQTIPILGITPGVLSTYGEHATVLLTPGYTSEVFINMREICRRQSRLHKDSKNRAPAFYFHGPLSSVAQELSEEEIKLNVLYDLSTMSEEIAELDINAYKEYISEKRKEVQEQINSMPYNEVTKQVLSIENDIYALRSITQSIWIMVQVAVDHEKIDLGKAEEYERELIKNFPKDFLSVLKDFTIINTPAALLSGKFRKDIPLLQRMKGMLADLWSTTQGPFFDAAKAAEIYQNIKEFKPLTEADRSKFTSLPEAYCILIEKENNHLLRVIEANKKKDFNINELGEVSNEELFPSLISPFRDKVVLVDFWATWCGPCRTANKAMLSLKEELKDKDIIYLYITGETSPLETWKNMIPDIHGEHFRVTDTQWDYLMKTFRIEGVPTYLIIDRDGEIKYKETGFRGVKEMKEKLLMISD